MKRKLDIGSSINADATDESVNPWTGKSYTSRYYEILAKRKQLPVYEFKADLIAKAKANQVVIVVGETGSGTNSLFIFIY